MSTSANDQQAVPAGYKRTEVGVIPEDWETRRLGELGKVVRGASPRPAGDSRFFNGSFARWLTVAALTNIPDWQLLVVQTAGCLTDLGAKFSRRLERGTVIIANSGATLGVAKLLGMSCCANDGIAAIVDQRSGNKGFLCQFINTHTSHLREVVATGNGQPNLNTTLIGEIWVPFPPASEQHAIAEALSDVDEMIGALDKLIAKKRAIKQGAMQQLLTGKTRLPGFSGAWEVMTLGTRGRCLRGVSYNGGNDLSATDARSTKRLLRSNNVQGSAIVITDVQFVDEARVSDNQIMRFGDILVCTANGSRDLVGKAGYFDVFDGYDYTFGAFMGCFRTDPQQASPHYVSYLFQSDEYKKQLDVLLAGSSINNLKPSDIESIVCSFPNQEEQRAIAAVLSDIDAEIEALERRREKVRAVKQGMMQALLTGKVRLVQPQEIIAAA